MIANRAIIGLGIIALLIISCNTSVDVSKRRYTKGYHVNISKQKKIDHDKINTNKPVAKEDVASVNDLGQRSP